MGQLSVHELFGLKPSSHDWLYAADWLEDRCGCPVKAAAMRAGIYAPAPVIASDGDGNGYGNGDGNGDGYGNGNESAG